MASRKKTLETVNQYSIELYYLLNKRKIKPHRLYEILKNNEKEEIPLLLIPVREKYIEVLKDNYTKKDYLTEILYMTDNKYDHLKSIMNIVNTDEIIDDIIDKVSYEKKLKLYYTDKIIDILVEHFYDLENIKLLSQLKKDILALEKKLNMKIINSIDNHYIKRITI